MKTRNSGPTSRILRAVFRAALSVVCVMFSSAAAGAQDAHYWTEGFGPRASLLSGAVIGSVSDISGTFYNPGALGLAASLPFALSTTVYEYENLLLEDGAGRGVDLATTNSGVRPSLLAGTITNTLFGRDVLAYSLLTRTRESSDVNAEVVASGAGVPPNLGLEDLVGIARTDGKFSDLWAGISYSRALGSKFGLGITWYGAARSQRRRTEGIEEAIDTTGAPQVRIDIRAVNYSTLRTLAKVGGYFASGPVSAGLTVTTPSLHITGSGDFGVNNSVFSSDTTLLVANTQSGVSAEYKSPLSVGIGLGWQLGKARLNASGEWFDTIDSYVVMRGEDFTTQEPEEIRRFDVVQAMGNVLNWALGLEYTLKESVVGYVSFATDYSGITDEIERADLSIGAFDIYSAFVGADFLVNGSRLTVGAGYGWGSALAPMITDVIGGAGDGFDARFVYKRFRILFGFELGVE